MKAKILIWGIWLLLFLQISHKEWFVKSAKTWTMYDENDGEGSVFDIE